MYLDLLREAILKVITDKGFSLPSPQAIMMARSCAEKILEWVSENEFELV